LIAAAVLFEVRFYHYREDLRAREQALNENRKKIAQQREQQENLIATAASVLRAPRLVGAADSLLLLTALPGDSWNSGYFDAVYDALSQLRETRRVTGYPAAVNSVITNPKKPLLLALTAGSPPVMHFLKVQDGGRTVSRLDRMNAPGLVSGWGMARWSPDGERI
jgi:hypothetical protein